MRKINQLGISLLVFVLITTLAGIPAVFAGGKKLIGFSSVGRFSLAFIAGEKYLERYSKAEGWDFISAIAENDAAKQAQDIDDLVARGVDLVIIMAVDSNAINSTVRALHADDIPMIGYMRPQDPSAKVLYDAFAGQDTVAQAYDASISVKKMMAKNGLKGSDVRILHVVGDPKDENALLRKKGFEKAAAENGWKIVSEITCDGWSLDKALTGSTNALEADSSINMVMLASDYLWPGVKTALKNKSKLFKRGEKGHVYIASQDLFPVGVDDIEAGYMDASTILDMGGMAITAIEMAKRVLAGEKFTENTTPKKQNWMAGRTITIDNLHTEEALWGLEFHPDRK
jgi:ABC-type sugar transport system substrate-binding protein